MILDASVPAKWVLAGAEEPLREPANRILRDCLEGVARVVVPDLFWPEMVNLLARAVRRGRIAARAADAGLELLREVGLATRPTLHLAGPALQLAVRWQMPAYDFFYILLAGELGEQMVTADERLLHGLGGHFPLRWLGSLA